MTRSELRSLILTNSGNRTDKYDVANASIDLCAARLGQLHDWQQMKSTVEMPIVAGDYFITLPDGTRRITELRIIFGVQSYPLRMVSKIEAVKQMPNAPAQPQGFPALCYREQDANGNDTVVFQPVSNGTYSIRMTTVQNPTIGPGDQDVCGVPDLDECFEAFGTEKVFASIGVWDQASQWAARFNARFAESRLADIRQPALSRVREQHPGVEPTSGDPQHDPFVTRWP